MRRTLSREFYIPKNYAARVVPKGVLAEIYFFDHGKPAAMGFGGKRSAPDFHFTFADELKRNNYVSRYIDGLIDRKKAKDDRTAKAKAFEHTLKVDDILYTSWGYDQTNIDFYQVTKVVGKKSVEIRRVHSTTVKTENDHRGADYVIPMKDHFMGKDRGKTRLKRVSEGNSIRIASYAHATPWDGTPKYKTAFGWGH